MARLQLHLFGTFHATFNGQPLSPQLRSDKVRALLAYLVVERGRPHRRDMLAALLWDGVLQTAARTSLRQALSNLRRALASYHLSNPALLHITRHVVQLDMPRGGVQCDLVTFETLLGTALPGSAARWSAEGFYRGDFLAGLSPANAPAFAEWQSARRETYHDGVLELLHQIMAYHDTRREDEQLLHYAHRTLGLEPWDETAHYHLMRTFAKQGHIHAALAQYDKFQQILAQEFGNSPPTRMRALFERLQEPQ